MERSDGVVSVNVRPSNVASGHHTCLIYSILILVIDKVDLDLGATGRNASASDRDKVIQGVKVIDLI